MASTRSVCSGRSQGYDTWGLSPGIESLLPPVPSSFKCPITHDVMRDPVVTQDGHVYERDAIQEWFRRGHRSSPVTGMMLPNLALIPEVPLRRAIEEYMCLRPDIARKEYNLRSDLAAAQDAAKCLEEELHAKKLLLAGILKVQRTKAEEHMRASSARRAREALQAEPLQEMRQEHFGPHHSCSELPMPRLGRSRDSTPNSDVEDCDNGLGAPRDRSSGPPAVMMAIPTPCRGRAPAPRKWKSPVNSEAVLPDAAGAERSSACPNMNPDGSAQRATKLQELMKAVRANFRGKSARRHRHSTGTMGSMPGEPVDGIR